MSFICHIHNYTEYKLQWNVFSAFNPSKRTHLEQWEADTAASGEQLGVRYLAQGSHLSRGQFLSQPRFKPTTLDYKSNTLSNDPQLPRALTRLAGSGPHGQLCDRCVHQPTRWSTLPSHVATRPPPPPLESEASEVASRNSHSGLAQPGSQWAVMSCAPRRVETPSPDGPADLETFRTRTGRPVHIPRDFSLSVVLLPDRHYPLARTRWHTAGRGAFASMHFPQWALSHRYCARSGRTRSKSYSWRHTGPLGPGSQSWCSSWQPLFGRFFWGRIYWLRDGAPCGTRIQTSGNVMSGPSMARGSRWPTPRGRRHHHFTRHAYALKWNLFVEWCSSHREHPRKCPIRVVLSFLHYGLARRLSPSTLKVYIGCDCCQPRPCGREVGGEAWLGLQVP